MKTHEAARVLISLASVLKSMPDVEITELKTTRLQSMFDLSSQPDLTILDKLTLLQSLQRIKKADLVELIERFKLPIQFRPRDGARDLLLRVASCLLEDPRYRQELGSSNSAVSASKGLLDALDVLLRKKD